MPQIRPVNRQDSASRDTKPLPAGGGFSLGAIMGDVVQFPARAGYVDQADTVEEHGGGMIVIDPLLDEWIDDEEDEAA